MSYLNISNLYRPEAQVIFLFKEVYALEKIHGTSAHISFLARLFSDTSPELTFFSGGESNERFRALFEPDVLREKFVALQMPVDKQVIVYGEAYGGKQQGMSATYGKDLKFVAFDVKVGDRWLSVPDAHDVCQKLGIEFVSYIKVPTDIERLNAERDRPSQQAVRNGVSVCEVDGTITNPKPMEGIVIRPLVEFTLNNGGRVIAKHKRDEFRETASPRVVEDPAKLKVLADAEAIADEWVVPMRLQHVLDKIPDHGMEKMGEIIKSMVEDVLREGAGEIVDSPAVRKAISKKTSAAYKALLQSQLNKI